MTNIAMENHHFQWETALQMGIFHSYVKLPEGILEDTSSSASSQLDSHKKFDTWDHPRYPLVLWYMAMENTHPINHGSVFIGKSPIFIGKSPYGNGT